MLFFISKWRISTLEVKFTHLHIVIQQILDGICIYSHPFHRRMFHRFDTVRSYNRPSYAGNFYLRNLINSCTCNRQLNQHKYHHLHMDSHHNHSRLHHSSFRSIQDDKHIHSWIGYRRKHHEHTVQININQFFHDIFFQ